MQQRSPRFGVTCLAIVAVLSGCSSTGPATSALATPIQASSSAPASPTPSSPEAFAQIPATGGAPAPLRPGTVSSPEGFVPALTFEVPEGWYGHGNRDGFGIGTAFNLADERFDGPSIYVDVIDMPLDQATSKFAQIVGLSLLSGPVQGSVGGHAATTFTARPKGDEPVALEEALGIGVDIVPDAVQQIFVDLGSKTLLIRTETLDESTLAALEATLGSLRFAS